MAQGRKFVSGLFSLVAQSCPTLCDPVDCSMPDFPVNHQLPELTQTHVHWVSDAIQPSSSVIPFSSQLQSFPESGSFQMSQFFASGGQSIGASASASVLPMNIQDWFPLGWTGWISLQSKGLSSFLQHHSSCRAIGQFLSSHHSRKKFNFQLLFYMGSLVPAPRRSQSLELHLPPL